MGLPVPVMRRLGEGLWVRNDLGSKIKLHRIRSEQERAGRDPHHLGSTKGFEPCGVRNLNPWWGKRTITMDIENRGYK